MNAMPGRCRRMAASSFSFFRGAGCVCCAFGVWVGWHLVERGMGSGDGEPCDVCAHDCAHIVFRG